MEDEITIPEEKPRKIIEFTDVAEMIIIVFGLVFVLVFLARLMGPEDKEAFQLTNLLYLVVTSLLLVITTVLYITRHGPAEGLSKYKSFGALAALNSMIIYLLIVFRVDYQFAAVLVTVAFASASALTWLARYRIMESNARLYLLGIWPVTVAVSFFAVFQASQFPEVQGMLLLFGLAGAIVVIYAAFGIFDPERRWTERLGFSTVTFGLLMVWLSTSRTAAAGAATKVYGEVDIVLVATGAAACIAGLVLLAWRRAIDIRIRQTMNKGHDSYQKGDWDAAINRYTTVLDMDPGNKVAQTCQADAFSEEKKYNKAMKIYNEVLKEDPEFTPAICGKGSALRLAGEVEKSIVYLQKALNVDPDSKIAWNNKGNAFFFEGKFETAIYCYKKAIEIDPSYSGAWYNLAVAYTNLGQYLEADHAFRTATKLLEEKEKRAVKIVRKRVSRKPVDLRLPEFFHLEFLSGDSERRILDHLTYHPGEDRDSIAQNLVMGESEVKAILARLVRGGFLKAKRDKDLKRYYPRKAMPLELEVAEIIGGSEVSRKTRYLTDVQRAILAALSTGEGLTVDEIAKRMEMSRQIIEFHTQTLTKSGVIRKKRVHGEVKFFPHAEQ